MPRLQTIVFLLSLICVVGSPQAWAKQPAAKKTQKDEVDHVALAAMLARDGHDDRARVVLKQVDVRKKGVNLKLYYTLSGILALKARTYKIAIGHFEDAIRVGQHNDMVFVYLAQCYYGLQNWERTILSVKNADQTGKKFAELFLMRAQSEWQLKRFHLVWQTLQDGLQHHPGHVAMLRQRTFVLVRLTLHQAAVESAEEYLAQIEPTAEDYIALALAFKEAGQQNRALTFLEVARLRFPEHQQVVLHLAYMYRAQGKLIAAGDLLQRASWVHEKLAYEAAEMFRQARQFQRALFMNTRLVDQPTKFKQRTSILIDQQDFEQVAQLSPRLYRLGLYEDENILYALAYAHFKTRNYAQSEAIIKRISDPQLFEYATQLRRMIALCEKEPMHCGD